MPRNYHGITTELPRNRHGGHGDTRTIAEWTRNGHGIRGTTAELLRNRCGIAAAGTGGHRYFTERLLSMHNNVSVKAPCLVVSARPVSLHCERFSCQAQVKGACVDLGYVFGDGTPAEQ